MIPIFAPRIPPPPLSSIYPRYLSNKIIRSAPVVDDEKISANKKLEMIEKADNRYKDLFVTPTTQHKNNQQSKPPPRAKNNPQSATSNDFTERIIKEMAIMSQHYEVIINELKGNVNESYVEHPLYIISSNDCYSAKKRLTTGVICGVIDTLNSIDPTTINKMDAATRIMIKYNLYFDSEHIKPPSFTDFKKSWEYTIFQKMLPNLKKLLLLQVPRKLSDEEHYFNFLTFYNLNNLPPKTYKRKINTVPCAHSICFAAHFLSYKYKWNYSGGDKNVPLISINIQLNTTPSRRCIHVARHHPNYHKQIELRTIYYYINTYIYIRCNK